MKISFNTARDDVQLKRVGMNEQIKSKHTYTTYSNKRKKIVFQFSIWDYDAE